MTLMQQEGVENRNSDITLLHQLKGIFNFQVFQNFSHFNRTQVLNLLTPKQHQFGTNFRHSPFSCPPQYSIKMYDTVGLWLFSIRNDDS